MGVICLGPLIVQRCFVCFALFLNRKKGWYGANNKETDELTIVLDNFPQITNKVPRQRNRK